MYPDFLRVLIHDAALAGWWFGTTLGGADAWARAVGAMPLYGLLQAVVYGPLQAA
jgi:hypothetical protein